MRATVLHGPKDVRLEDVPDPRIEDPADALVRVTAACVCGSDLWPYRGIRPTPQPRRLGHEFVGVVEETGAAVTRVRPGDFVIAPFAISDGTCPHCRNGVTTSCERGQWWGSDTDGAQGEFVRVPLADGTLVATPGVPDDAQVPALLALSDVMGTGHHAARAARVRPGRTVAVVGDGAVGLCAVLAARRLGAERIVAFSRHRDRQAVARRFGATDVVELRGDEGAAAVRELLGGVGADTVLECVGTRESMAQALATVRPGGAVGYVGVPAGGPELPIDRLFGTNVTVGGGVAPVRAYLPELLDDVLDGTLDPSPVFDLELPLAEVAEAYAAMDERRTIKPLLRP
ncbi:zinc-dependent alcohol dehydrogenase family protein [Spirilliplanes yamanashiensis]|uniref:IMP dehydrogenase n=1 Tax=Spirilliplanes yamanashiensis TaxID=42233 RepID=A0A8J3YAU9_9ACTN|nr:zinc-dependent alcohol dehydrogenase family protein [Spirilliplanes yamanashiensis]MDP9817712.1 threonine dehydrogenase-like Zn-dependent dehydrogenase [Spirilliplanes yamanashiensis]GIJ04522.1 IMP dehydrogenase [Spirilliplanes yamanashiensis]